MFASECARALLSVGGRGHEKPSKIGHTYGWVMSKFVLIPQPRTSMNQMRIEDHTGRLECVTPGSMRRRHTNNKNLKESPYVHLFVAAVPVWLKTALALRRLAGKCTNRQCKERWQDIPCLLLF
eukprot:5362453-Pyramimonas_sp.AAC.1